MINKKLKFDEKKDEIYLKNFSPLRYKFFQFIEKLYKNIINNEDKRINLITEIFIRKNPKRILEIGSGVFPIYQFLPHTLKNSCKYYICEVNKEKVLYLIEKYPQAEIKTASALNLPYRNNYFDIVFSKGVFHHIDDNDFLKRKEKKIRFLKESKRVLKKGGTALLIDFYYNPKRLRDVFWHKLYKIILWESDYNYLNREEAESLFKISGYGNIKSLETDTFKGLYYYVTGEK